MSTGGVPVVKSKLPVRLTLRQATGETLLRILIASLSPTAGFCSYTGEHAKPGEAILRAGDSALSIYKAHRISSFAQLISLCCDMGKKRSSSDVGNLTNLGCGLV